MSSAISVSTAPASDLRMESGSSDQSSSLKTGRTTAR